MKGKFTKISRLEALVLLLTALFAAGTLLWFFLGGEPAEVTFTGDGQAPAPSETVEEPAAPGLLEGEILDLNTATLSDLTRLPGIGEGKGRPFWTGERPTEALTRWKSCWRSGALARAFWPSFAPM